MSEEKKSASEAEDSARKKEPASEENPASEGAPEGEEELRAKLEEEIRKVRVEDLLLQSIVSVLNLSARRIAKEDERDLEQAKVGIDASRAVVDLLPAEAREQVREALSELQMLYAKTASGPKRSPDEEKPQAGQAGDPGEEGKPGDSEEKGKAGDSDA